MSQEEPEPEAEERTLQTVVVRGVFIPEPQRQTSQVASFLSAEDRTRQGDANAALALTRLSGLSVVDGQFAYVRGLGDRYSVALLNGAPLPSPEPLRRTVPLDLFPSSMLDGAAVQKTFSANYPGEFGGGLIDLKTVRQPAEDFLMLRRFALALLPMVTMVSIASADDVVSLGDTDSGQVDAALASIFDDTLPAPSAVSWPQAKACDHQTIAP